MYGVIIGTNIGIQSPHKNSDCKMYSALNGSIW